MIIYSIYDYYLEHSLRDLSEIPFENQLNECTDLKIVILDYCGISSKYISKFRNCDIYLVTDQFENTSECIINYDVVYVLADESQSIFLCKPYLKIICEKNRLAKRTTFHHVQDINEDNSISYTEYMS